MTKINVLDQGFVELVDSMGDDQSVLRSARVSYNSDRKEWEPEKDKGLLRYLIRNRHTSPFESVVFTFHVKAPIFVFRQWHRHRTWCLAGGTPLLFNRPCDGKAYPMPLREVVRKWNPPAPNRQRSERTLQDYNREVLGSMFMRSPSGDVHITDSWFSGSKPVYRLKTDKGEVTASADHLFNTPDGGMRISDNPSYVLAMVPFGGNKALSTAPAFTHKEIKKERWIGCREGYEISDLGRVRSYWGQGKRSKSTTPILKKLTANRAGRLIVGMKGEVLQVSRLVHEAFIGGTSSGQVLHKNDNPLDNRLSNLYLGSPKDNSDDQYVNGGRAMLRTVPVKVDSISFAGIEDTFDISVTGDHWFVANNLVVHNSYNEISARYAELNEGYYVPAVEQITTQSSDNKQMRTNSYHPEGELIANVINDSCEQSFRVYKSLIEKGCPRELARSVLPVAAYSRMYATVNLHNLMHFLTLRDHEHAQYEIRVYAAAMAELAATVVPEIMSAWKTIRGSAA